MPVPKIIPLRLFQDNFAYLLNVPGSAKAVVVDAGEAGPVLRLLQEQQWQLELILCTHHHPDHVGGHLELAARTGAPVWGPEDPRIPGLSRGLHEGEDLLLLGALPLQILEAPGHTRSHLLLHLPQSQDLFCGDVLFGLGAGRFGKSAGRLREGEAQDALVGLRKLRTLPNNTHLYWGHDYTEANAAWVRRCGLASDQDVEAYLQQRPAGDVPGNLGREKALNPFLGWDNPLLQRRLELPCGADDAIVLNAVRSSRSET